MADETPQADWKCDFCNRTDEVKNGFCPDCGATQTTPLSDAAKKEAGVLVDPLPDQQTQDQIKENQQGQE